MLIMDMAVRHSILSMLITVNKNPVCSVPDANSVHLVAAGRRPGCDDADGMFGGIEGYMGFRFWLSLSTIQAIRFSRPASVFASRYARV